MNGSFPTVFGNGATGPETTTWDIMPKWIKLAIEILDENFGVTCSVAREAHCEYDYSEAGRPILTYYPEESYWMVSVQRKITLEAVEEFLQKEEIKSSGPTSAVYSLLKRGLGEIQALQAELNPSNKYWN